MEEATLQDIMSDVVNGYVDISSVSPAIRNAIRTLWSQNDIGSELYTICLSLHQRAASSQRVEDYNKAINLSLLCLPLINEDEDNHIYAAFHRDIGLSLATRAEMLFSSSDADSALRHNQVAYDRLPRSHTNFAMFASSLAVAYRIKFHILGQKSDIEAAYDLVKEAMREMEGGRELNPGIYHECSLIIQAMVEHGMSPSMKHLVDEAVHASQKAVSISQESESFTYTNANIDPIVEQPNLLIQERLALYKVGYCNALEIRYQLEPDPPDIKLAIESGKKLLKNLPSDHLRPVIQQTLAGIFLSHFEQEDNVESLEKALQLSLDALKEPYLTELQRRQITNTRAIALQCSFERTANFDHLNESIELLEKSAWQQEIFSMTSLEAQNLLAIALDIRYVCQHSLEDLDTSIDIFTSLLGSSDPSTGLLNNLAIVRMHRYYRLGNGSDLTAADDLTKKLVNQSNCPEQIYYWIIRSQVLCELAKMRTKPAKAIKDLKRAVDYGKKAIEALKDFPNNPDRAIYLAQVGKASLGLWKYQKSVTNVLQLAVESYRSAADVVTCTNPDFYEYLFNAAEAKAHLGAGDSGNTTTLVMLDEVFNTSLAMTQVRIRAGRCMARLLSLTDLSQAAKVLEASTRLLLDLSPPQIEIRDRQYLLSDFGRMVSEAATIMAVTDCPALQIIQILEHGRFVILGQTLDSRTDLSDLQAVNEKLAQDLVQAQQDLSKEASKVVVFQTSRGIRSYQPRTLNHDAARRLQVLKDRVRATPGFRNFLRPVVDEKLLNLSMRGALIYIAVADVRDYGLSEDQAGFAFLLHQSNFQTVKLTDLKLKDLKAKVQVFELALSRVREDRGAASQALTSMMAWIYDVVALPVIDALGWRFEGSQSRLQRRIWWITTGLLSGLPLHGAGKYDHESGHLLEGVSDIAVSSYTSTARALLYSQQTMEQYYDDHGDGISCDQKHRALLVSMSQTPGEADLPNAKPEVNTVRSILGLEEEPFDKPDTRLVLDGLSHASIAHFACHGTSDTHDPSKSGLLLSDCVTRRLDVRSLARQRLSSAALVYLSACKTMDSRVETLSDECIHVASGFQAAGFAHAIGTFWSVWDDCSVTVAAVFYRSLMGDGMRFDLRGNRVAVAIDRAVRALREEGASPVQWIPYAHYGI